MQNGNRFFLSCHQTSANHSIIRLGIGFVPRTADFRNILCKLCFSRLILHHKDDISAFEQHLQMGLNDRILRRAFRFPVFKETQNRLRHRMLHILQNLHVLSDTCRKALTRAFRLSLRVKPSI